MCEDEEEIEQLITIKREQDNESEMISHCLLF